MQILKVNLHWQDGVSFKKVIVIFTIVQLHFFTFLFAGVGQSEDYFQQQQIIGRLKVGIPNTHCGIIAPLVLKIE